MSLERPSWGLDLDEFREVLGSYLSHCIGVVSEFSEFQVGKIMAGPTASQGVLFELVMEAQGGLSKALVSFQVHNLDLSFRYPEESQFHQGTWWKHLLLPKPPRGAKLPRQNGHFSALVFKDPSRQGL